MLILGSLSACFRRPGVEVPFGRRSGKQVSAPIQTDLFERRKRDEQQPIRFVVVGDQGANTKVSRQVARQMKQWHKNPATTYDTVLTMGDNVYGDDEKSDGLPSLFKDRIWKLFRYFFKQGVRFYPVMGNHDIHTGYSDVQRRYWGTPTDPPYYKFSRGPIEFFALDTTPFLPGMERCYVNNPEEAERIANEELTWLEENLRESRAQFKIVYSHQPLFAPSRVPLRQKQAAILRDKLQALYEAYGVDLVLAGHEHVYERTRSINGVQYMISGGGAKLHHIPDPQDYPREKLLESYHFLWFELKNNQLHVKAVDHTGQVIDDAVLLSKQPAHMQVAV